MIFTEEELQAPHAGPTYAVEILAFVEAQEIPPLYFETPYYLAPVPGDEKIYALLRETLRSARKIGIAYVVIQARQHLAAVVPHGQSLVLNTLRWNIGADRLFRQFEEEDEDFDDDDYLHPVVRPRLHPGDDNAARYSRTARWRHQPRSRFRGWRN